MTRRAAVAVTAALFASMVASIAPAQAAPAKAGKAAVVPVASRPDAYAAMMAAKKQKSPVEVLDYRTDASQTFANPDGTFSYSTFAQPKWVKRGGAWKDLDATLVQAKNGTWSPALSESSLVLSGGGTGALATMTVDGKQLGLTWPTALPKPTASGATLTYANVLPSGVDLQVTATAAGGVEETLVIKNATAAADPGLADLTQAVNASNGTSVSTDAGGNLSDTGGGRLLVNSPAPVMWDSATTAGTATTPAPAGAHAAQAAVAPQTVSHSTAHTPGNHAHQARVKASFKNHKLHLSADASLLSAKTTVFPVYEDPAFVPHPASGATMNWDEVQQAYPTTSNYDAAPGTGLAVGYQGFSSPTGIERTFYELSIPSSIYGAKIISATLNTKVTYAAASGSNSTTVQAFSVSPIHSTTTWNAQPSKDTGANNPNYPSPNGSATFTTTSQSPNLAVSINVTSGMQSIANQSVNNWTIGLFNATETNDVDLVRFADNPTFSITYNNPPATPTNLSLTPSNVVGSTTYTSTGTPTLSASATDANSDTVQYGYQVLSGSTVKASGTTAFVNSGSTATWTPSTALADGAYTWQVRAYDGHDYSAWTTAKAFTVDTSTPPAPGVSCSGYPAGVWTPALAGGTTCSLTDTATDTMGFSWGLDSGSSTWVSGTSATISINPATGYHTLWVSDYSKANKQGTEAYYVFGVGSAGLTSPADQSSTSTTLPLSGTAPPGATTVTFKYRVGTSGTFQNIPTSAVNGVSAWPVATVSGTGEVTSPNLTWDLRKTVADDGLLQVEAVFYAANGNATTTAPVNVTLDRLGTGTDFGTTQTGPVTVGLQSGNASVSTTDVNIASYGSGLSVSRTFNSLKPTTNTGFGPGWTTSLPVAGTSASWASVTDDGSYALLTGKDGSTLSFAAGTASNGTTPYTAQGAAAASGLTLSKTSSGFALTDTSGIQITFVLPTGGIGGLYLPSTVTQPGSGKSTGFIYDPNTGATQGKLMLLVAPNAATSTANTTACPYPATSASWASGCRGLAFSYDSGSGNISEIDLLTSDGTTLTRTPVAQYTYDTQGRLATEWDPRVSPALVTAYSYDETSADADYGRLTQISPAQKAGSNALAPWVLAYNDTATSADYGKLASVSRTHNSANGGGTAKTVIAYSVPLTVAAGGPSDMDAATVAGWGQTDVPTSAVAVFPADHAPSGTITDWTYAQILYFDAQGRQVNTSSYNNGWNITTTEYDQNGNDVRELTAANRATALAAGSQSAAVAAQLDTRNVYSADGTELTDTYGPAHQALAAGSVQTVRTHTHKIYDQGAPNSDKDANGNPYQLVTTQTVGASLGDAVPGSGDVDGRTTQYVYNNGSDNEGWTLHAPLQTITDPGTGHLDITKSVAYNESSSLYGGEPLQISSSQPGDTAGTGAGTTQTVYYTAGGNSVDSACGNQPAWTDLICKTEPAAQPGTTGLSNLPVTLYTYNGNLQPVAKTETFSGGATRTTTVSYDAAGRPSRSSIVVTGAGMGTAVPDVVTTFDPSTGQISDSQTVDGSNNVTADLHSSYDDFGQLSLYEDATSQVTTYTYDLAGRVTGRSDAHGSSTVSYNGGTVRNGLPTSVTDSAAGTFSATYDADGNILTQAYPGGTSAGYTYDSTDRAVQLVYSNANWAAAITDSVTVNAVGDWAARSLLNDSQSLSYDAADRITNVADTLAGQCTTRGYSYDADSNRTGLTVSAPNTDGTCQTATSTSSTHAYDAADRITDTGVSYDTQGDITALPDADTVGGATTSSYYASGMVASQTQSGTTYNWQLDPSRNRSATWTNSATGVTTANHYGDETDNPSWTSDSTGGWTRNVTGLTGSLAASVSSSGTTTLILAGLHDDVIATALPSDTSPNATFSYDEFGNVEQGTPGQYGWFGASQRSDTALGGSVLMGARVYSSVLGRFTSPDPIMGGNSNAYDYAFQNPLTDSDLTGMAGRSGLHCGSTYWTAWCDYDINESWTQRIIDWFYGIAYGAAAVAGVVQWIIWASGGTATPFGAGLVAIAGLIAGLAGAIGWALHKIDQWGGDRGIYLEVGAFKIHYWWWGWRVKYQLGWAYIWHQ